MVNFPRGSIAQRLSLNIYHVDEKPHIILKPEQCKDCKFQSCIYICPAGCFELVDGAILFSYEGCLECGSCLLVCGNQGLEWNYPRGGKGISYQQG